MDLTWATLVYIVIQDSNDYVLDSGVSFNKRSWRISVEILTSLATHADMVSAVSALCTYSYTSLHSIMCVSFSIANWWNIIYFLTTDYSKHLAI